MILSRAHMAISPDIMAGRRPSTPEYVLPKVQFVPDPEPHLQANELAGQRWIVTGAGRENGIGAAIVNLALMRGAHVLFTATPWGSEEAMKLRDGYREKGFNADLYIGNLREESVAKSLMEEAIRVMGGVDVVVNDAGKTFDGDSRQRTRSEYQEAAELGLFAPFEIKQAAIEQFIAQGRDGGLVVDINSVAREGNRWQAIYASLKAGLRAQNQSLSDEFARRYKIRFVDIESGLVLGTNMTIDITPGLQKSLVELPGGERDVYRVEVAQAVAIAASPRRSNNITRTTLQVIGGEDYDKYMIVPQEKPQNPEQTAA